MENILPVLDHEEIQKRTNEYAMKGALKSIEEFYTGYNSPYRKAIDEILKKQEIGYSMELPDIIALINTTLSKEIDIIANTAVAKTFVPVVQRFLTRVEKDVTMTDILKEFVEATESASYESVSVEFLPHIEYDWITLTLEAESITYQVTLHTESFSKKEKDKPVRYQFLSLPTVIEKTSSFSTSRYAPVTKQTMKLALDGVTLEIPFTRDVLQDRFCTFVARMILCKSIITIDTKDFSEDMFPDECHCP